jgi:hypothetical protein
VPRTGETGHVEVAVAAPAAVVGALVRDVTRMTDWSPEIVRVRWRGRHRGPGARFRGWSRAGVVLWVRTCEVLVDEPGRFEFVTRPAWWNHDATRWTFEVEGDGPDRSRLRQTHEVLRGAPWFIRHGGVLVGRAPRLPGYQQATVTAIARAAERLVR